MVRGEQATSAPVDLPASSLLVLYLELQGRPLSASQRESAADLQKQLCAAPWASAEDRQRAHGLVLRLELLLGPKAGLPGGREDRLRGRPQGR
jgi:hypothetical protein